MLDPCTDSKSAITNEHAQGSTAVAVPAQPARCPLSWQKRLLAFGFMFFLIKGLLWLLIPATIAVLAWLR